MIRVVLLPFFLSISETPLYLILFGNLAEKPIGHQYYEQEYGERFLRHAVMKKG
jgi:hypothetical protein